MQWPDTIPLKYISRENRIQDVKEMRFEHIGFAMNLKHFAKNQLCLQEKVHSSIRGHNNARNLAIAAERIPQSIFIWSEILQSQMRTVRSRGLRESTIGCNACNADIAD